MNFNFLPEDAKQLLFILSPLLPVFATYLLSKTEWKTVAKAGIAFALCALTAFITAYANGTLVESFWGNFFATYTGAQAVYWSVFKGLGLERWIAPREAVAGIAANELKTQVALIPDKDVEAILNPKLPTEVAVDTKVLV